MGNECWYFRARYAGMTKVCMTQSIVECGRIRRFGLCPFPEASEEWRRCGFAIGQFENQCAVCSLRAGNFCPEAKRGIPDPFKGTPDWCPYMVED